MSDLVPLHPNFVTPESQQIREHATSVASGASIAALANLATLAGFDAWRSQNDYAMNSLDKKVNESFATPIPTADVFAWREAGGYQYGDRLQKRTLALDVKEAEHTDARGLWFWNDTGVRIVVATPLRGQRSIPDDPNHPRLDLNVRLFTTPGVNDPGKMQARIGHNQLGKVGHEIDTRSTQELLIVAGRFALMLSRTDAETLNQLPTLSKRHQRRFAAALTK